MNTNIICLPLEILLSLIFEIFILVNFILDSKASNQVSSNVKLNMVESSKDRVDTNDFPIND